MSTTETFLVPFKWEDPAPQSIIVTGTFDNWQSTGKLDKLPAGNFEGKIAMPCGAKILFKYIVDGNWLVRDDEPKECDESGNLNHFVIVPHAPVVEKKVEEAEAVKAIVPPTQSDDVVAAASHQPIKTSQELKEREVVLNKEEQKPSVAEKAKEVAQSSAAAASAAVTAASAQVSKAVNSASSNSSSHPAAAPAAAPSRTPVPATESSTSNAASTTAHHASASEKLTSAANVVKAAATDAVSKTAEFVSSHTNHSTTASKQAPATATASANAEIYSTDTQPVLPPKPSSMDAVVAPAVTSPVAVNALPSTPVKSARVPLVPYAASPFTPAPTNGLSNKENGLPSSVTAATATTGDSPKTFPVTSSPASDNSSAAAQHKRGILSSFSRRSSDNRVVSGSSPADPSVPPSTSENPVLRKRKSSLLAMVKAMWGSPQKPKNAAAGGK